MAKLRLLALLLVGFSLLTGCATSSTTVGADFDETQVVNIVKGKTTSAELVAMFGEPHSKNVLDKTQQKWVYLYSEIESKAQGFMFVMDVKTTGIQKTLDVLLEDDVVVNYSFSERPIDQSLYVN